MKRSQNNQIKKMRKRLPREDEFADIIQALVKIKSNPKYEDFRFGQIISSAIALDENCNADLYYTRDEELLEAIKKI